MSLFYAKTIIHCIVIAYCSTSIIDRFVENIFCLFFICVLFLLWSFFMNN